MVPFNFDVVNFKPKLLRSTSKSNIDSKPDTQTINKTNNNNKQEYNPLAGVSFKPTHSSDVEIVGVKLGSNSNQDNGYSNGANNINNNNNNNSNTKKKASFQSKSYDLKRKILIFNYFSNFFYSYK